MNITFARMYIWIENANKCVVLPCNFFIIVCRYWVNLYTKHKLALDSMRWNKTLSMGQPIDDDEDDNWPCSYSRARELHANAPRYTILQIHTFTPFYMRFYTWPTCITWVCVWYTSRAAHRSQWCYWYLSQSVAQFSCILHKHKHSTTTECTCDQQKRVEQNEKSSSIACMLIYYHDRICETIAIFMEMCCVVFTLVLWCWRSCAVHI